MKAISIRQPWADLIMAGEKFCENRTWRTRYRGPLAIHASGKPDPTAPFGGQVGVILGTVDLVDCVDFRRLRDVAYLDRTAKGPRREAALRLAETVSDLLGVPVADLPALESWEYVEGPVCWIVGRPVLFDEPIPAKGKLGLWTADIPSLAKA